MPTIFISYRRADSASEAGRLYDRLVERYGESGVFKDVDSIPPGVRFPEYITEALEASDVALILIGPRWLDASSGWGRRRLDDPADFVRIEIETALRLGIAVIPVLVNGAKMPPAHRLPENLRPLLQQNAVSLRQDPDFSHDVERVFHAVDYWQAQPRTPAPKAPSASPAPENADEDASDAHQDSATIVKSPLAPRPAPAKVAVAAASASASEERPKRQSRRAPALAAAAFALVVVVTLATVLRGLPGKAGATSLTAAQQTQTASAFAAASVTADAHAIQTNAAIANHLTPITPGYTTANPGCDVTHWAPPLSAKRDCSATGMTLSGVDNTYDHASAVVSESQEYFTVRVTVTNLQEGCAITLQGDEQTLLITLQQQSTALTWSVEVGQGGFIGYAPTSGTEPAAASYVIVMRFVNNDNVPWNDLALSINGRPLPTTGKIDPMPSGSYEAYYVGHVKTVGLSLAGSQGSSTGHASATFSDFSLKAP